MSLALLVGVGEGVLVGWLRESVEEERRFLCTEGSGVEWTDILRDGLVGEGNIVLPA